jgi:hypothetical protein
MKVGDKVWVLCEVAMVYKDRAALYMDIRHDGAVFEAKASDCRPVEPDHDDHPVEFKVGDRVVSWSGRQGVVEAINEIEGFPITVRHSMREQVSYKLGGVKHDDHPVEPEAIDPNTKTANHQLRQSLMDYPFGEPANPPKILDSSSEPMRDAFEDWITPNYDWDQSYLARNENRYFDSSVETAWQAYQAGAKYQSSPLAPSPCMDGVNVDQFVDGTMEARGRTDFKVGDSVRIKDDKDERLPLVVRSLQPSGSSNAPIALCVSECGKRVRWTALEEMERINQSDPVNPSHYKQGGIECIEAIKAALGEGFPDYLRGNVMKYLWRYKEKGGVGDLRKSAWYLDRLIKEVGE